MESAEIVGVAGSMMIAGIMAWRGEYTASVGIITMTLGYVFARNATGIMKLRQALPETPDKKA